MLLKAGSRIDITDTHLEALPKLKSDGVYQLCLDPRNGQYFLSEVQKFTLPKKLYGNYDIIDRWKKSYEHNTEKNLGILLSGLKGSGKTLLAKKFCMDMNLPTIVVNEGYSGTEFINFLTNPALGKYILYIDEFEKIYPDRYNDNEKNPSDLLSIMDGTYDTNIIFLYTINKFNISEYLINRLNRIKYRIHYENLDESVIDEVIEDLLINKKNKGSIYSLFDLIGMCTYDLLINIIKEMNLFNDNALAAAKHLNLKLEPQEYSINVYYNKQKIKYFDNIILYPEDEDRVYNIYVGTYNTDKSSIVGELLEKDGQDPMDGEYRLRFKYSELTKNENGVFKYNDDNNVTIKLDKVVKKHYSPF